MLIVIVVIHQSNSILSSTQYTISEQHDILHNPHHENTISHTHLHIHSIEHNKKRRLATNPSPDAGPIPAAQVTPPSYQPPSFYNPRNQKKPYQVPIVLIYTVVSNFCKHGLPRYVQDVLQHTLQFQYNNDLIFAGNFYECPRLLKDLQHGGLNSIVISPLIKNDSILLTGNQRVDDRSKWDTEHINNGVSSSFIQNILGTARFPRLNNEERLNSKTSSGSARGSSSTSVPSSSSTDTTEELLGILSAENSSITLLDIHTIASARTMQFINASKEIFLSDGKNELWFTSATRFLHLQDVMEFLSLSELIHIESDNLLYVDLSDKSQIVNNLRQYYPMAITPLVANLHILTASFFYVAKPNYLNHLNEYFMNITVSPSFLSHSHFSLSRY